MIYGLFIVSGLAVGSLYALGGTGLVILRRSTGVLNFAYGAIAAGAAMFAWQVAEWGAFAPVAWMSSIFAGIILSVAYGRFFAPSLAWREPTVKAVATLGYMLILLGLIGIVWDDGILLFALAIVGGAYSWIGAIIAGLLYKLLPALFNDLGLSAH